MRAECINLNDHEVIRQHTNSQEEFWKKLGHLMILEDVSSFRAGLTHNDQVLGRIVGMEQISRVGFEDALENLQGILCIDGFLRGGTTLNGVADYFLSVAEDQIQPEQSYSIQANMITRSGEQIPAFYFGNYENIRS